MSVTGSGYDVDRPGAGERRTEIERGDHERVGAGRQAAQHAEVAGSHDGRRSGRGPERVAGLRENIELIGDGQETVAQDVLGRTAVDADHDLEDAFGPPEVRQGARALPGRRLCEERCQLGVRARDAGQRDDHLRARLDRAGASGLWKQDLAVCQRRARVDRLAGVEGREAGDEDLLGAHPTDGRKRRDLASARAGGRIGLRGRKDDRQCRERHQHSNATAVPHDARPPCPVQDQPSHSHEVIASVARGT